LVVVRSDGRACRNSSPGIVALLGLISGAHAHPEDAHTQTDAHHGLHRGVTEAHVPAQSGYVGGTDAFVIAAAAAKSIK